MAPDPLNSSLPVTYFSFGLCSSSLIHHCLHHPFSGFSSVLRPWTLVLYPWLTPLAIFWSPKGFSCMSTVWATSYTTMPLWCDSFPSKFLICWTLDIRLRVYWIFPSQCLLGLLNSVWPEPSSHTLMLTFLVFAYLLSFLGGYTINLIPNWESQSQFNPLPLTPHLQPLSSTVHSTCRIASESLPVSLFQPQNLGGLSFLCILKYTFN